MWIEYNNYSLINLDKIRSIDLCKDSMQLIWSNGEKTIIRKEEIPKEFLILGKKILSACQHINKAEVETNEV